MQKVCEKDILKYIMYYFRYVFPSQNFSSCLFFPALFPQASILLSFHCPLALYGGLNAGRCSPGQLSHCAVSTLSAQKIYFPIGSYMHMAGGKWLRGKGYFFNYLLEIYPSLMTTRKKIPRV